MATDAGSSTDAGPLPPAVLFHTGVTVEDLASAREEGGRMLEFNSIEGEGGIPLARIEGRTSTAVNIGSYHADENPAGVYHDGRNGLYIEILNRALPPMIFGTQS